MLLDSFSTLDSRKNVNEEHHGTWVKDSWTKTATIDGKWMFFLSPEFINDKAKT